MPNDISSSHGSGLPALGEPLPDFSEFRHIRYRGEMEPMDFKSPPWSALLDAMHAERQNVGSVAMPDNENIPAGFTYFGQFLAHDITAGRTFDLSSPNLRLLSLYGGGPAMTPYLYVHYPDDLYIGDKTARDAAYDRFRHAKLMLGDRAMDSAKQIRTRTPLDVPRSNDSLPLMADTRNDQNYILSQLHVAIIRFHNAVAEHLNFQSQQKLQMGLADEELTDAKLFEKAREVVIWCYQRIIVEEYLRMLVYDPALIDRLKRSEQYFSMFKAELPPRLMPEFSMAAFRIGHSQVQEVYQLSGERSNKPVRLSIFRAVENGKKNGKSLDLRGFARHKDLKIDWPLFFDFPGQPLAQPGSAIDQHIPHPLFNLIFMQRGDNKLPQINLQRSQVLPSGHAMAEPLYEEVNRYDKKPSADAHTLLSEADVEKSLKVPGMTPERLPLWLYVLLEAGIKQGGQRLGVLGSHIVAEQILWVLHRDDHSYLKLDKNEIAQLNTDFEGLIDLQQFSMSDLLQFPDKSAEKIAAAKKRAANPRAANRSPSQLNAAMPRGTVTNLYVWNENDPATVFATDLAGFTQLTADFANKPLVTTVLGLPMYLDAENAALKRNITTFFSGKSVEEVTGLIVSATDILDKVLGITITLGVENNQLCLLARSADGKGRYPPDLAGADLGGGRQFKILPNGTDAAITLAEFNSLKQAFVTADAGHNLLKAVGGQSLFNIKKQTLYNMLSISMGQQVNGSAEYHLGLRQGDLTETDPQQQNYINMVAKKSNTEFIVGSTCPPKWYHPGA